MSAGRRWDDLAPRLASGAAMVTVGLVAVWLGGVWFHLLVALICGMMIWELVCMVDSGRTKSQYVLGAAGFATALVVAWVPPGFAFPLLLFPSMLGFSRMEKGGVTYAVFTALILLAGYGMIVLRDDIGLRWMLWLVTVVVVTDVAGYFAGKSLGGPLFWPRVSPKKTWSGTIAGWAGAAIVGLFFAGVTPAGAGLAGISIAVSMASQIGDISESAIKRRAGVKDSSSLIPGHGGLLDRFDGMLGASVFLMIAGQAVGFPPGV
ncbi:phosphatidate cytidylyltransferase [Pseudoponticoccus marisrubri]|uniref:Phosphatidate cytidylyltransferase n=1 Tax=Pseudoponticoccus marisrubri TaxID=1685382 RepID=A0A0W7WMT5_9RHOB|nr:phosphatidate cytidylyltransferase [Pseudoponticoccus marisrubri]KUF11913.1 phosphatidate cytidylyltransferase [Pseudoponticoccus marisrubri]